MVFSQGVNRPGKTQKEKRQDLRSCFLQESFPDHAILGEETSTNEELGRVDSALAESDWTWIVDPIDGTLNFVRCLDVALIWCS
jgi:fructose-1,6-bisphosphatase/inositol monophosphatase family enzyme